MQDPQSAETAEALDLIAGLMEDVKQDTGRISGSIARISGAFDTIATQDNLESLNTAVVKAIAADKNIYVSVPQRQTDTLAAAAEKKAYDGAVHGAHSGAQAALGKKATQTEWIVRGIVALVALLLGAVIALYLLARSDATEFSEAMRGRGMLADRYCELASGNVTSDVRGRACVIWFEKTGRTLNLDP